MKTIKSLIVLCVIISAFATPLSSQSIGINYGVAGVENFDPAHSFHISITSSHGAGFFSKMTLMSWTGEDNNRRFMGDYSSRSEFFGNRGMNFTVYKELYRNINHSLALGAGVGFYQRVLFNNEVETKLFEPGLSTNLRYRYDLTERFNIISEASLHFGDFNFEFDGLVPGGIDWGFLTIGLEYESFR